MTRWAVSEVGSCRQALGGHLVYFRRPSGQASLPKKTFFRRTGPSASTWGPATRVDASTKDAAGSESSYLALTLTEAIRVVTVK
jgi:hypothetical protein